MFNFDHNWFCGADNVQLGASISQAAFRRDESPWRGEIGPGNKWAPRRRAAMDTRSDGEASDGVRGHPDDDADTLDMRQRPLALPLIILGGVIIWCVVLWFIL
jgi:hypothetical protein